MPPKRYGDGCSTGLGYPPEWGERLSQIGLCSLTPADVSRYPRPESLLAGAEERRPRTGIPAFTHRWIVMRERPTRRPAARMPKYSESSWVIGAPRELERGKIASAGGATTTDEALTPFALCSAG
jgi:hypothetical protein